MKKIRQDKMFAWALGLVLGLILLAGCATTGQPGGSTPAVPAGCEKALVYQIPDFMPGGPVAIRVAASTAIAVATAAGHAEIRGVFALAMPTAYKAVMGGNLAGALTAVTTQLKAPKVAAYAAPFLVLFDSLAQAGVIKGSPASLGLTECDRNVLGSLFKNIGLDAGADPAAFL